MNNKVKMIAVCSLAAFGMVIGAQADVVSATYSARHNIQGNFQDGVTAPAFSANNNNGRRLGAGGAATTQRVNVPVIEFALPTLTGGTTITGADFGITWLNPAINAGLSADGIVTLMNYDATDDFSGADFNDNVSSLGNGSLAGTFTAAQVTDGGTLNVSLGAPALSLLQSFYTGDTPNQASVFLRLSLDGAYDWATDANKRYQLGLANPADANSAVLTTFSVTTVPEPATFGLVAIFGGAVLFVRRRFCI